MKSLLRIFFLFALVFCLFGCETYDYSETDNNNNSMDDYYEETWERELYVCPSVTVVFLNGIKLKLPSFSYSDDVWYSDGFYYSDKNTSWKYWDYLDYCNQHKDFPAASKVSISSSSDYNSYLPTYMDGDVLWSASYSDKNFSERIYDWPEGAVKTLRRIYKTYGSYDNERMFYPLPTDEVIQDGVDEIEIFIKDDDMSIGFGTLYADVYDDKNLKCGTLKFAAKDNFIELTTNRVDNTHLVTDLYLDKDKNNRLDFPVEGKKLLFNEFVLYADFGGVFFDKSLFECNSLGVSLKESLPDGITEMIVPRIDSTSPYAKTDVLYRIESNYLKKVTIEDGYNTIGYSCFSNDKKLEAVVVPESVETIDYNAFEGCYLLKEIELPSVSSIGDSAFSECTALTDVAMPLVRNIGENAFSNCVSLKEIDMPYVSEIGSEAFCLCPLKEVTLPVSLSSLGENVFSDDVSIKYEGTKAQWKARVKDLVKFSV